MLTPTVSCAQIDATMPRTRNHADDNAQVLLPSENALGARTHAALRQSHSLCRSSPRALDLHSSNISYSLTIGAHMNNLVKIGRGGICAMTKQHVLDVVIVVEVKPATSDSRRTMRQHPVDCTRLSIEISGIRTRP